MLFQKQAVHISIKSVNEIHINSWLIRNGEIQISGTIELTLCLQPALGSDMQEVNEPVETEISTYSFCTRTDKDFTVLGNSHDGFDMNIEKIK